MKIVFNIILPGHSLREYKSLPEEVIKRIVKKNPQHEFILISDQSNDPKPVSGNNITVVVTRSPGTHPLIRKLWYDIKLPGILRKYKADLFVSFDGFCSLTTKLPQCIVVQDLSFTKSSHLFFYKRYMPKFLNSASAIITVSDFLKRELVSRYQVERGKINIVYSGGKENLDPLEGNEKEETKRKYTNGKNYFVYAGEIHSQKILINLLKAFSVFKKRQKSDWRLVLTGKLSAVGNGFIESLKTYKHREDVLLINQAEEEEVAKLTGSAYALVYPSYQEGFGVTVLEALKCGVPVITSVNSAMQEIAGEAALYADPSDYRDIADKMMLIYKDESLRDTLVEKGKIAAAQYSWDKTADLFWQSILKACLASGKTVK